MVIVGGALAFTAIGVYFAWYFLKTGQARWRERAAEEAARRQAQIRHREYRREVSSCSPKQADGPLLRERSL